MNSSDKGPDEGWPRAECRHLQWFTTWRHLRNVQWLLPFLILENVLHLAMLSQKQLKTKLISKSGKHFFSLIDNTFNREVLLVLWCSWWSNNLSWLLLNYLMIEIDKVRELWIHPLSVCVSVLYMLFFFSRRIELNEWLTLIVFFCFLLTPKALDSNALITLLKPYTPTPRKF